MSDLPLKATLKAGTDYSAPWLTVDGHDPSDLKIKLDSIIEGGVLQSLIEAANALKAANNAAPLLAGNIVTGGPHDASLLPPVPQAFPTGPGGWGQQAPQQAAPQQQPPQGNRYGGATHPEGKSCGACGKVLEMKTTGSGKSAWRCPDWRWNNGNPNGHTQEWA